MHVLQRRVPEVIMLKRNLYTSTREEHVREHPHMHTPSHPPIHMNTRERKRENGGTEGQRIFFFSNPTGIFFPPPPQPQTNQMTFANKYLTIITE